MKKVIGLALFCAVSFNAHAYPATTTGLTDATKSGDIVTFIFDSVKTDYRAVNSLTFSAFGIDFSVTQTGGNFINQDSPANGGLGVDGSSYGDNIEVGEKLTFNFASQVDLLGGTVNGMKGGNGHQDTASGKIIFATSTGALSTQNAKDWDGVGSEFVYNGSLADSVSGYSALNWFSLASNGWNGYSESISVRLVPEPATLGLLGLGLAGLVASRRRRIS